MQETKKANGKGRGAQSRGKNAHQGEKQPGAANGHTSTPFGDHTPAFLLKPVPLVA